MRPTWQQPRHGSGWAPTLRRWGSPLARVTPFAIGLLIPSPVAVAIAGTGLVAGVAGIVATRLSNPWRDFRPEPGERWDPEVDELPEPGLLDALGLTGFRVHGVLRGGDRTDPWLAFQTVDRLGGHSTRLVVRLDGTATVPMDMVGPATHRPDATEPLSLQAFGRYRPTRGFSEAAERHYRLSSENMRAVLSEATVRRWSVHEQYLVGELYDLGRAALRVNLQQSVGWLQRLRDAFPATLLQPVQRAEPAGDETDWPLMERGQPVSDDEVSFSPKPSRRGRGRARRPRSP